MKGLPFYKKFADQFLLDCRSMDAAHIGIAEVLRAEAWRGERDQPACTLPADLEALYRLVRAHATREQFDQCIDAILKEFKREGDRYLDPALAEQFDHIQALTGERQAAGRKGAANRWKVAKPKQTDSSAIAKPLAQPKQTDGDKDLERDVDREKDSTPAVAKDPRHAEVKQLIFDAYQANDLQATWDGSEARALAQWLKAQPRVTVDAIKRMICNRFQSHGNPLGERPRVWLPHLAKYAEGPLDKFNRLRDTHSEATVGMR